MGLQVNAILAVPDHINIFSDSAKITNKILSFFEFKKLGFFFELLWKGNPTVNEGDCEVSWRSSSQKPSGINVKCDWLQP